MTDIDDSANKFPSEDNEQLTSMGEPTTIANRYEVERLLGVGGMGKVYLAIDPVLQRDVAVKVLAGTSYSDEHIRRFHQEARAASKLSHQGIVRALDFGVTDSREPYLVMEYVAGQSLQELLKICGTLDLADFGAVFSQIIISMVHAHSEGVVHRDLKPSNIIICDDLDERRVYLVDFGIAKILNDSGTFHNTKTGQILGSPPYLSPEQVCGSDLDGRSDIYSLGCVMFEALTGNPPFKGDNPMETIQMHLNDPPPRLNRGSGGSFPEELEAVIAKALEKEPDDRFQSMQELLTHLNGVLSFSDSDDDIGSEGSDSIDQTNSGGQNTDNRQRPLKNLLSVIFVCGISIVIGAIVVSMNLKEEEKLPRFKNVDSYPTLKAAGVIVENFSSHEKTSSNDLQSGISAGDKAGENIGNQSANEQGTGKTLFDAYNGYFVETRENSMDLLRIGDQDKLARADNLVLTRITDTRFIANLPRCINLVQLDLSYSNEITDDVLVKISNLKHLQYLKLNYTKVTPAGLKRAFGGRQNLVVEVGHCKAFESNSERSTAKFIGLKKLIK